MSDLSIRWRRKMLLALVRSLAGIRVLDGGEMGTLVRCHECGGEGLLHRLDRLPPSPPPAASGGSGEHHD